VNNEPVAYFGEKSMVYNNSATTDPADSVHFYHAGTGSYLFAPPNKTGAKGSPVFMQGESYHFRLGAVNN
jgi:hypothetical protein